MVTSILILALFVVIGRADVRTATTSGLLQGISVKTKVGTVHKYLGVPYAKPPLGKLRFRPPEQLDPSDSEYNASFHRAACIQESHVESFKSPPLRRFDDFITSEDCLYLNIYAPAKAKRLPVMVWIAGEDFDFSDPQRYDGTYLALLGKVIVITVNYRLGIFGYLSTLTEKAPGNVALLDQRAALQWVKNNIAAFGGDPGKVTLFGTDSGSAMVSIHLASPLHKKEPLFQRAILQGSVTTGDHVLEKNPRKAVWKLADMLRCGGDTDNMLECLQGIPAEFLLFVSSATDYSWRPIIDGKFLTAEPLEVFAQSTLNTDVLLGTNKDCGSICYLYLFFVRNDAFGQVKFNFLSVNTYKYIIDDTLADYFKCHDINIRRAVYEKYSPFTKTGGSLRDRYFKFCGDMYIRWAMVSAARKLSVSGRVYMYQFDHRPSFSQHAAFFDAAHGDDVVFTFGLAYKYKKSKEEEKQLSKATVKAFANFAKTGDPNWDKKYNWPRFTSANPAVFHFDTKMPLVTKADDPVFSFWEKEVPKCSADGGFP